MRLELPVPISPNRVPSNPFAAQRKKDEYRRVAWCRAIQQHKPPRDPPGMVKLDARFRFAKRLRDEDNLQASLKWVLDSLRQKQTGALRWRLGLYTKCGYFVDDDPEHLSVETSQEKVRTKLEEGLILTLEAV